MTKKLIELEKLYKFNISFDFNSSKYKDEFLNNLPKKDIFIIDFEAFSSQDGEKFHKNRKISESPISCSILKIKSNVKEIIHLNFFDYDLNYEKIWNEKILGNYDFEEVIVWGERLEKNILFDLISLTSSENFIKLKKLLNWIDLQKFFMEKIWEDKLAIFNFVLNNKNMTSLQDVSYWFKYLLNNYNIDETIKYSGYIPGFEKRKLNNLFFKVDYFYLNFIENKQIRLNQKIKIFRELEKYNNKDVEDIYFIYSNLNLVKSILIK